MWWVAGILLLAVVFWLRARLSHDRAPRDPRGCLVELDGSGFIAIERIGLYGRVFYSRSGKWALALESGSAGRSRNRVASICEQRVAWVRSLERPAEGAISDSGYCVVNDWGEGAAGGTFFAFSPQGEELIRASFGTNLMSCGCDEGGAYCWCATRPSRDGRVRPEVIVLSIQQPAVEIARFASPYGTVCGVVYDGNCVEVKTAEQAEYVFSLAGEMLSIQFAIGEALRSRSWSELSWIADLIVKYALSGVLHEETEQLIRAVLDNSDILEGDLRYKGWTEREGETWLEIDGRHKARIQRTLGELAMLIADRDAAVAHWRKALDYDPKVGVKRKLAALLRDDYQDVSASEGSS